MMGGEVPHCLQEVLLGTIALFSGRLSVVGRGGLRQARQAMGEELRSSGHGIIAIQYGRLGWGRETVVFEGRVKERRRAGAEMK